MKYRTRIFGNGWTISHQGGFRKKNYRTKAVGGSEYSEHMKRQVLQSNDMHTIGNWHNIYLMFELRYLVDPKIFCLRLRK